MIRGLGRLLAAVALAAVLILVLVVANTRPEPVYPARNAYPPEHLARAKALLAESGAGLAREGEIRTLHLTPADLDMGLNLILQRLAQSGGRVRLDPSELGMAASLRVPGLPWARYLELDLRLSVRDKRLVPTALGLGGLTLPEPWAGRLLNQAIEFSPYRRHLRAAQAMLQEADIRQGPKGERHLALSLRWQGSALRQALGGKTLGLAGVDESALQMYRERLEQVRGPDFHRAMTALFQLARTRAEPGDPVTENRAALVVLTESALGRRLFPDAASPPRKRSWRLEGRQDLVQHFALSALMAAAAGHGLADLAGLYKEIQDTGRGGSGFSFTDIAAGKAGTRLGEALILSRPEARQLQLRLAASESSGDYFPALADLPEFMSRAEFSRRFGGVGEPAYQAVMTEIESRIAGLPLYRQEASGAP